MRSGQLLCRLNDFYNPLKRNVTSEHINFLHGDCKADLHHSITKTCPCNKEIFLALKIEHFLLKNFDIFLIFAQNIDCGYTLEPPSRGSFNEYTQSMFCSKNKKNRYTPANPSFSM